MSITRVIEVNSKIDLLRSNDTVTLQPAAAATPGGGSKSATLPADVHQAREDMRVADDWATGQPEDKQEELRLMKHPFIRWSCGEQLHVKYICTANAACFSGRYTLL